jgi:hypothetical protein
VLKLNQVHLVPDLFIGRFISWIMGLIFFGLFSFFAFGNQINKGVFKSIPKIKSRFISGKIWFKLRKNK